MAEENRVNDLLEAGYTWFGYGEATDASSTWVSPDEIEEFHSIDDVWKHYIVNYYEKKVAQAATDRERLVNNGYIPTVKDTDIWWKKGQVVFQSTKSALNDLTITERLKTALEKQSDIVDTTKAILKLIWAREFLTDTISHIGRVSIPIGKVSQDYIRLHELAKIARDDIDKLKEEILEYTGFTKDDLDIK